ncbi:hypothetical protein GCM10027176_51860 [Actinoallomurus bryophytorum]
MTHTPALAKTATSAETKLKANNLKTRLSAGSSVVHARDLDTATGYEIARRTIIG